MTARLAAALAALLVGACATVLPKPPEQLYRFGFQSGASTFGTASVESALVTTLALRRVTLPRASAGDAILTSRGERVAYVARVRWASPAVVLLQEAVARAFAAEPRVRLLARGDAAPGGVELELDGLDFETRYSEVGSPPQVRVALRAALVRPDGSVIADRTFALDQPATENRVGPIVAAYDLAVTAVLSQTVAWSRREAPEPALAPARGVAPAP